VKITIVEFDKKSGEVTGLFRECITPQDVFLEICESDYNKFYYTTDDKPGETITSVDELVLYRNNS